MLIAVLREAQVRRFRRQVAGQLNPRLKVEGIIVNAGFALCLEVIQNGILGDLQLSCVVDALINVLGLAAHPVVLKQQAFARFDRGNVGSVPAHCVVCQGFTVPLVAQPRLIARIGQIPRQAKLFVHYLNVHDVRVGMRTPIQAVLQEHIPGIVP